MKKNNKGFILLETLVVSTFIISTLVFLYVQFINLKKNYDISFRYNTIPGLYGAKIIDKFIKENYGYGNFIDDISKSKNEFVEIYNSKDKCNFNYFSDNISFCESLNDKLNIKTVLISSNNTDKLKENLKDNNKYSNELYLYVKNETLKNDNVYSLIVEYNDNSFASLDIKNTEKKYLCRRATTLHTEECRQTDESFYCSGAGYTKNGSKKTTTITYGNLGTKGTLTSGDAFDCDVNGDGKYDSKTERFYYVSDYYNTTSKNFENDTAVLIYYNNTTKGLADNTNSSLIAYDSSNENWHGPRTAISNLPTKNQWITVNLKNNNRSILTETGSNSTKGGTLPTNFSYNNYSSRLLSAPEINNACNITIGNYSNGELETCNYLMENSKYSNSNLTFGYWIDSPTTSGSAYVYGIESKNRRAGGVSSNDTASFGIRPAIEVLKYDIDY